MLVSCGMPRGAKVEVVLHHGHETAGVCRLLVGDELLCGINGGPAGNKLATRHFGQCCTCKRKFATIKLNHIDEFGRVVQEDSRADLIFKHVDLAQLRVFPKPASRESVVGIPVDRDRSFRPIVTDDSGLS